MIKDAVLEIVSATNFEFCLSRSNINNVANLYILNWLIIYSNLSILLINKNVEINNHSYTQSNDEPSTTFITPRGGMHHTLS